ncbi:MAG TPA: hypothetical protein PL010_12205 [Flavobacteriales bacterium]|nr:hypothetical protein [Flavobacteriales bacterium]HMW96876.1 hypothetical protein [Flavobacteriales bacterium]HNE81756.1 hypothetical protein [Flavobacteriales bacterium]HNI05377.1 hypothetical protein [Flavobacteriales bacterium]HNK39859.1 hypothetical protein [Flavobacteriales bacterium]
MKRIELNAVRPPQDPDSPIIAEHWYTVILGNHHHVHFRSERHALAFAAEAERVINDQLFICNLLLSEAFAAYRMAWPLYAHNKPGGASNDLRKADAKAKAHVMLAWESMDKAITHTGGPNGTFFAWRFVLTCAEEVRALALDLAQLYRNKTWGIERARMDVLVQRANGVRDTLQHVGADAPNAVKVVHSPYA